MSETVSNKTSGRKGSVGWFVVLVLVAVAGYAYVNRPVEAAVAWGDDLPAASAAARERGTGVLINFTTTGCIYCMRMDREVFSRTDVAESLQRFETVKLHWSNASDVGSRYGVESFPTFVVVDPDGKALIVAEGYLPVDEFKRFVRRASELVWPEGRGAAADRPGGP